VSTRKNVISARAAALLTQAPTEPAAAVDAPAVPAQTAAAPAPRVKPVRVVVELQPVEHRNLRRLSDSFADEIGVPQVAMAEVVRVLLDVVQDDERLAARVVKELARTGGTRRR
jgi:hypothetical protein